MPFEIVPPGTQIDFIGKRRIAAALSIALLVAGAIAVATNGVKLGIDFEGGTEMQVLFDQSATVDEGAIRSIVKACGIEEPAVVRYGETDEMEFLIRFHMGETATAETGACEILPEQQEALEQARQAGGGGGDAGEKGETIDKLTFALQNAIGSLEVQRVEFVGPRVGAELRAAGRNSLLVACGLILLYIAFRFSARFAPGAVIALIHDVGITAGIFVMLGLEFDLRVLAALLAIVGYSLNDTIIIYDRIRENMELRTKFDLVDVLNQSINQTLARTVITSSTTMVAVLALGVFGGEIIRPFSIAMAIGILVGTYSSIFIAAPTLLFLENYFGDSGAAVAGGGDRTSPAHHDASSRPPRTGARKNRSQRKKSKRG